MTDNERIQEITNFHDGSPTRAASHIFELIEMVQQRDKMISELDSEIERLSKLTLHELIADSNGINMKIGGASGKAFMAALIKFFEDNGGKNFLAMTVEKDGFKYQIEIRNLKGELSAAEKLDLVEQQNIIMLSALERIRDCPCVGLEDYVRFVDAESCEALAKVKAFTASEQ